MLGRCCLPCARYWQPLLHPLRYGTSMCGGQAELMLRRLCCMAAPAAAAGTYAVAGVQPSCAICATQLRHFCGSQLRKCMHTV